MTEKGGFIVPTKIEDEFSPNSYIEQLCLLGLGMPQPIMVVVPSENGAKKSKTELAKSFETTMLAVNEILPRYTKVSTVVIAKEPFTIENGLLTPTLKVKRFNVHQNYASQLKTYCEHKDNVIWA